MNKLPNRRSFNYDIKSLLAYPPASLPQPEEVVMQITGLPGTGGNNGWAGFTEDGVYPLNGTETVTHSPEFHKWTFHNPGIYGRLNMTAEDKTSYELLYFWLTYDTTNDSHYAYIQYINTQVPPTNATTEWGSIKGACFGSADLNGVHFAWSKGGDWGKGDM